MSAFQSRHDFDTQSDGDIDRELNRLETAIEQRWNLGRCRLVAWRQVEGGIEILIAPSYALLEHAEAHHRMTDGTRRMGNRAFAAVAEILEIESEFVPFAAPIGDGAGAVPVATIESLAVRYSISRTRNRAIALFDIVGFSLLSQVEQVAQLNSLEVSINVALQCMQMAGLNINLGRSTTGDGYYVWNRVKGPEDDVKLSFLMMLVLADNAISRGVVGPRMVPRLRTCLTIGSHFTYYQVEGLQRSATEYIVGDATIELARLVAQTMPDQILVGAFYRPLESGGEPLDSLAFMGAVQRRLDDFTGADLDSGRISGIRCYFTGEKQADGRFFVSKYNVIDKHGLAHSAFNAKMNIYRDGAEPLYLGVQTQSLGEFAARLKATSVNTLPAPWD